VRIQKSVMIFCLAMSLASHAFTAQADTVTGDKGGDMLVDLVVLRPIGLVSTVVGGAVFVLGLPFTLPSGSVGESACELVKRPAAYTFTRPLGDFDGCTGPDCTRCTKPGTRGQD
jgi:hypothetical protein